MCTFKNRPKSSKSKEIKGIHSDLKPKENLIEQVFLFGIEETLPYN